MSLIIHRYSGATADYWAIVIEGVRNSWESWEKGDSHFTNQETLDCGTRDALQTGYYIGMNDRALCQRLVKAGNDHGKFLRQIPLALDLSAPEYWWKEFDQYKIGTTTNSTSMMHILGKQPFDESMFCFEDIQRGYIDMLIEQLNLLRDHWIDTGKRKSSREWRAMLQGTPNSWIYRRATTLNYQVLASMYHSRKNHKLSEWRQFCEWIKTLPYSELITGSDN